MAEGNIGHARRVGIATSAPSTLELEFLSCTLAKNAQHVQSDGIRGQRGRQSESVVDGVYTVDGDLVLEPRVDNMALLLQLALGGTPSAGSVSPAEALPTFVVDVNKGDQSYRYAGCKVDQLVIRSNANTPLQFALRIMGLTETGGITFPDIAASLSALPPFIHHELVMTVAGTARKAANFELTINNFLIGDRFYNSQTRQSLPEGDRQISLAFDVPNTTDESDLYGVAVAGVAGSAVWTKGGTSLGLTFGKLQIPDTGASINGKNQEVTRRVVFDVRKSGSTAEVVAAIDAS